MVSAHPRFDCCSSGMGRRSVVRAMASTSLLSITPHRTASMRQAIGIDERRLMGSSVACCRHSLARDSSHSGDAVGKTLITPDQLEAGAVVPQCLDNQYV